MTYIDMHLKTHLVLMSIPYGYIYYGANEKLGRLNMAFILTSERCQGNQIKFIEQDGELLQNQSENDILARWYFKHLKIGIISGFSLVTGKMYMAVQLKKFLA